MLEEWMHADIRGLQVARGTCQSEFNHKKCEEIKRVVLAQDNHRKVRSHWLQ